VSRLVNSRTTEIINDVCLTGIMMCRYVHNEATLPEASASEVKRQNDKEIEQDYQLCNQFVYIYWRRGAEWM